MVVWVFLKFVMGLRKSDVRSMKTVGTGVYVCAIDRWILGFRLRCSTSFRVYSVDEGWFSQQAAE